MKHSYFTYNELISSETAKKHGIKNEPIGNVAYHLGRLASHLDAIREDLGSIIRVNSGFRSDSLNRMVGGVNNSYHLFGRAADISTPRPFPVFAAVVLRHCGFEYDARVDHYEDSSFEVHLYPMRNFIHFAIKY